MEKHEQQGLRYFDIIMAMFVAVLLISNIASTKIVALWHFSFDGGTLLFPLAYIFGDVLTEVYGYSRARRAIWTAFAAAALMSLTLTAVVALPAARDWPHQEAFRAIIGLTPRIVLGSLIAFWAGSFLNSYLMSRLKIISRGRRLWVRTIGSTLLGEGLDTMLFALIAFAGVLPGGLLLALIVSNYIFKCGVEILFTPITYLAVNFLKSREQADVYDTEVNYNPLKFSC